LGNNIEKAHKKSVLFKLNKLKIKIDNNNWIDYTNIEIRNSLLKRVEILKKTIFMRV
jgi:hypothetical protein